MLPVPRARTGGRWLGTPRRAAGAGAADGCVSGAAEPTMGQPERRPGITLGSSPSGRKGAGKAAPCLHPSPTPLHPTSSASTGLLDWHPSLLLQEPSMERRQTAARGPPHVDARDWSPPPRAVPPPCPTNKTKVLLLTGGCCLALHSWLSKVGRPNGAQGTLPRPAAGGLISSAT